MKIIQKDNIVIEVEHREGSFFEETVRGYEMNEENEPVKFLGKFIITSNYTEDEIIGLFTKEEEHMEETTRILGENYDERFGLDDYDAYDPFEGED